MDAHKMKKDEFKQNVLGLKDESVRDRLLAAAADIFNRKGYSAASVGEIVAAAGVTKPSLYYYFHSKEGIFLELFKDPVQRFDTMIKTIPYQDKSPWENLRSLCDQVLGLLLDNLPATRLMHAIYYGPPQGAPHIDFESFHEAFQQAVLSLLAECVRRGEIRQGDPEDMAWAVLGMVDICVEGALCHPEMNIGRGHLSRLLDLLFVGLVNDRDKLLDSLSSQES